VEGESDDPVVLALRARQQRNFIATLMLSQGVPMLSHGDEFSRTQRGNNNAYCQDNELSWVHWPASASQSASASHSSTQGPAHTAAHGQPQSAPPLLDDDDPVAQLLEFTRYMVWLRRDHPVFRRRRFFHGRPVSGTHDDLTDIAWFTAGGEEMTDEDWRASFAKSLIVFLNGYAISEPDTRGERITDDSFLLLFNTGWEPLDFNVPLNHGKEWQIIVDTAQPWPIAPGSGAKVRAGDVLHLTDRSMMVLQRPA
jgi:isoamylase